MFMRTFNLWCNDRLDLQEIFDDLSSNFSISFCPPAVFSFQGWGGFTTMWLTSYLATNRDSAVQQMDSGTMLASTGLGRGQRELIIGDRQTLCGTGAVSIVPTDAYCTSGRCSLTAVVGLTTRWEVDDPCTPTSVRCQATSLGVSAGCFKRTCSFDNKINAASPPPR
jgi:hypothetical protein